MPGDKDSRKSVRVPVQIEARLSQEKNEKTGTALNLSSSGVFIRLSQPLMAFETWNIRFQLPGSAESMDLKGRVMWSTKVDYSGTAIHAAGFQFEQPDSGQTDELKKFIQNLLKS